MKPMSTKDKRWFSKYFKQDKAKKYDLLFHNETLCYSVSYATAVAKKKKLMSQGNYSGQEHLFRICIFDQSKIR